VERGLVGLDVPLLQERVYNDIFCILLSVFFPSYLR
jgi:hypothetical protein